MSPNPASFIVHLRESGYHPRSDKHSNALARAIIDDLQTHCPHIRARAQAGQLVYDLNFTLYAGTAEWNVDLVLGTPALDDTNNVSESIARSTPAVVEVAIEIKSVMTEHRKAVKNRKRDLEAHHEHVHNYSSYCIAGGVLVVNAASTFRSPLRNDITEHRSIDKLVRHCIDEFRSVSVRGGQTGYGLEAKCAIVVDIDNVDASHYRFVDALPAPQIGDPIHYDSFIRTVCEAYKRRFCDGS